MLNSRHVRRQFNGFHVILRGYMGRDGWMGQKIKICWNWLLEKSNKGWWGVSKDKNYWVRCKDGDFVYFSGKRRGYINLEKNTCMCLYLEKRDTRFRKKVRLGAIRVDGMQSGEVERKVLLWLYKCWEATQNNMYVAKVIIKYINIFQKQLFLFHPLNIMNTSTNSSLNSNLWLL